jgi:hypothetical protein
MVWRPKWPLGREFSAEQFASECTIDTSSISSGDSEGRIEGSLDASMVLPDPGGPTINRL